MAIYKLVNYYYYYYYYCRSCRTVWG